LTGHTFHSSPLPAPPQLSALPLPDALPTFTAFARWLETPAEHGGAATASLLRDAGTGDIEAWFAARHADSRATTANRSLAALRRDRKSTRLNSSHVKISYAVFCLKKKKQQQ